MCSWVTACENLEENEEAAEICVELLGMETQYGKKEDYIKLVAETAKSEGYYDYKVHLAVDTGMGRIGCYPEEAGNQAVLIEKSGLKLGGMCTHFAVSDSLSSENIDFTKEQFESFKTAVEGVKEKGIEPGICSCGASAALLNDEDIKFDMVRPGIITYGYYPDEITKEYLEKTGRHFDIKPVLALETKVVAIRHFPAGKSVSYGRTWVADHDTDIAVLPIGYADGLLRRFSPGLEVTINGKNYPVRGRICMDQCMVEIGKDNPDVKVWDRVVVFGPKESGALNTIGSITENCNAIISMTTVFHSNYLIWVSMQEYQPRQIPLLQKYLRCKAVNQQLPQMRP